jgi:hypothetical protein
MTSYLDRAYLQVQSDYSDNNMGDEMEIGISFWKM